MSTSVVKSWDLSKIVLDLSPEINRAATVIKRDIQEHIANEERIDGKGKQAPLSALTVAAKTAKGGAAALHANDILIETENLWRNQRIDKATTAKQSAEITVGPTREEIATYLQDGTERMPARPFFGISDKGEASILRMVELAIERKLRAL